MTKYNYRIVKDEDSALWGFQIGEFLQADSMEILAERIRYIDEYSAKIAALAFLDGMDFKRENL